MFVHVRIGKPSFGCFNLEHTNICDTRKKRSAISLLHWLCLFSSSYTFLCLVYYWSNRSSLCVFVFLFYIACFCLLLLDQKAHLWSDLSLLWSFLHNFLRKWTLISLEINIISYKNISLCLLLFRRRFATGLSHNYNCINGKER